MKRILILCVAIILFFSSCAKTREAKKTIFAMDTVMELTVYGNDGEAALTAGEAEIFRLDDLLDRGSEDSDIYKLNNDIDVDRVSPETIKLVRRALEVGASTDWAFDITIAPVVDIWGFYDQSYRVPSDDEITTALTKVGGDRVNVDEAVDLGETKIDLGGVAKGYASQRVSELFRNMGVDSALLNLGGNVQVIGTRPDGDPWRIAVQSPDGDGYAGVLSLSDAAAVTSGDYQRHFESGGVDYHHIIDPETGYPADSGLRSVTVVCEDATLADGLSTALFVMGLDAASDYWRENGGFEAVFITSVGEIYVTSGLKDKFESEYAYTVLENSITKQ
ncbi:MAG: FAD:protein FMN transferase [Oscillospiraceae bacterium]|nr:FAD:protein FMN transferase [Oscillospiraceae bacterium]